MPAPSIISRVVAREVFDSRGNPTVEVEIHCHQGASGSAIAPSGASKGRFEALELRDVADQRLGGRGVRHAVAQIEKVVAPALVGRDAADQAGIDRVLIEQNGAPSAPRLGGNATTAVSLAAPHAAAAAKGVSLVEHLYESWRDSHPARLASPPTAAVPAASASANSQAAARKPQSFLLPLPMVNMISGGLHAGKNLDFQDFLILPVGAATFREALDWIVTVYHVLGRLLNDRGFEGTLVGDEGGYGPRLESNTHAVEILLQAIEAAGFEPGRQIALGLDVASTHLVCDGGYRLYRQAGDRVWSVAEIVDLFAGWVEKYPIVSIEDPLGEDEQAGWGELTRRLGSRTQLIGDDLFVTNPERLQAGIDAGLANCVLVKVNQIGTLTETFATLRLAQAAGYRAVISARSGETEDSTIADLAVATGAGQIKIGSVARSERLAKYNQLLRLESRLEPAAVFRGGGVLPQSMMG